MKTVAFCFTLVLAVSTATFLERGVAPDVTATEVKSGFVVIQAFNSPGVVCDEGKGAAAAEIGCGGKSFKSVSAGEDTYSLLQDMGIEFGIKLNCDGAADWSGCQSDGMGAPTVCSAFVGCA
ncbi:uncharacterized protein LOC132719433 [Ruditapes philippinarum]|uniref:uncharacterized protein LOC132719433 n=1 Tax=Ruditapes philippinarum TaxID=129788 RepID=UPI00295B7965|nr:uncharacterized protein LOC132719433 [Ruditapes philippinarum]